MTTMISRFNRNLEVPLTDEEIQAKGQELAQLHADANQLRDNKSEIMKKLKGEIDEVEAKIEATAKAIRHKAEERPIECTEARNETKTTIEVIRVDTQEVVASRPMTMEELAQRQQDLFAVDRDVSDADGGDGRPTPDPDADDEEEEETLQ